MKIDVFDYIASNNPRACKQILQDFDYVANSRNTAQNLRDLVNLEGEDAVVEIMKYHPDRSYFEPDKSSKKLESMFDKFEKEKYAYLNATGSNQTVKTEHSNQTNTIILASAIILAFAIISKK
jgi:hypothetical protein